MSPTRREVLLGLIAAPVAVVGAKCALPEKAIPKTALPEKAIPRTYGPNRARITINGVELRGFPDSGVVYAAPNPRSHIDPELVAEIDAFFLEPYFLRFDGETDDQFRKRIQAALEQRSLA